MHLRGFLTLLAMGLLVLPGCGNSKGVAPVKGRVVCDGKPVADAVITFNPVSDSNSREPGKAATATSDADGNYVLSTYKPNDGALIGKHRVSITLDQNHPAPCKRETYIEVEVKPGDNDIKLPLAAAN